MSVQVTINEMHEHKDNFTAVSVWSYLLSQTQTLCNYEMKSNIKEDFLKEEVCVRLETPLGVASLLCNVLFNFDFVTKFRVGPSALVPTWPKVDM